MTYIKKLVLKGFKSFAKKTEIPFSREINVILGPNGSGKSNITDSLCFVLGRLNIKSMRAPKAKDLIFMGTKKISPAKEASVEIIFDNSNRTFAIDQKEISIKRIVRKNGQSVYKINNVSKTRQQILTLLAQVGIDPNGFNIILQGEIQNFVKMHPEERRKIIEEISGISIYESRKEKSIKELKKTEEKLKEVSAILRERTNYLNNLEKERQQALKYKKLEKNLKIYKASIINYDIIKKKKEIQKIIKEIEIKTKKIGKIKKEIQEIKLKIKKNEQEIEKINNKIQESTGLEQEKLNNEIADLRAYLEGTKVKLENSQAKIYEIEESEKELKKVINQEENSLKELEKETPTNLKNKKEIEIKQKELEELEKKRKEYYSNKGELKLINEKKEDKTHLLKSYSNESDSLLYQVKTMSSELFDKRTTIDKIEELKELIKNKKELFEKLNKKEIELEKKISASEYEIDQNKKIISDISKIDVCPVCKSRITKEHLNEIKKETNPKINLLLNAIKKADIELNEIYKKKKVLSTEIEERNIELSKRESDLIKIKTINEKKEQIKILQEKIKNSQKELNELEKIKKSLEKKINENLNLDRKIETLQLEVQEISLRNKETIDSEISFKQREIERAKINLKQIKRDKQEINEEITNLNKKIQEKTKELQEKRKEEERLNEKFRKMIENRERFNKEIKELEYNSIQKINEINLIEENKNNFKIEKAKIDAELENLESEKKEFSGIEIIKGNKENLLIKLKKTQEILNKIGNVNLRALEVYDSVKKEYDLINEKVEKINSEKSEILKIIHDIDIKKKKTFQKTFNELNTIFSNNFAQLSKKGQVYLELEDKKNPFNGGVNVIIKTGHGKYFGVTSLSGGEQTLIALSLIFAIQELKPYYFYILDEIDAALDKRNSERLANLLKKYMQKGQYIVISHNDEIISNATNLYGISMHDGISKVTSLRI